MLRKIYSNKEIDILKINTIFVHYKVLKLKIKIMIIISSGELSSNMKKYLDTAKKETVIIQRGKSETFVLQQIEKYPEPDDDLANAITLDELFEGVKSHIHAIFKKEKNENFSHTECPTISQ